MMGFLLIGTRLFIPKDLRKQVEEDLPSSHRGIEGTQERARLVVDWPSNDRQIAQECQTCQKRCQKDTIEKFNNDTASLKIKNSIESITQKMSNA